MIKLALFAKWRVSLVKDLGKGSQESGKCENGWSCVRPICRHVVEMVNLDGSY